MNLCMQRVVMADPDRGCSTIVRAETIGDLGMGIRPCRCH